MFTKFAAIVGLLTATMIAVAPAQARTRTELPAPKPPEASSKDPLIVVISLRRQRLTVYNRNGSVTESPISSGTAENPTTTGIFSVIGKSVEHYSNLYDDAPMPYMQRLTWTGTAMHAGHLPGYPASHGCIRLPYAFSQRLFDMTAINTRVIVSNSDVAPRSISHAKLMNPLPIADETVALQAVAGLGGGGSLTSRRSDDVAMSAAARARFAETQELYDAIKPVAAVHTARLDAQKVAQKTVNLARLELSALEEQVKTANGSIMRIERAREKLESQLAGIGRRMETARSDRALATLIDAEEAIEAKLFDLAKDLEGAKDTLAEAESVRADYDARIEAAADVQRLSVEAFREAAQDLKDARAAFALKKREDARYVRPVSVMISRKDQRLYVRQGFEPLLEVPVTIDDVDTPLGTHVYTAMGYRDGVAKLDWNVVSVPTRDGDKLDRGKQKAASATAALDRVQIPEDALVAITERIKPGSSIIISDDSTSPHFGDGTDFTVASR